MEPIKFEEVSGEMFRKVFEEIIRDTFSRRMPIGFTVETETGFVAKITTPNGDLAEVQVYVTINEDDFIENIEGEQ